MAERVVQDFGAEGGDCSTSHQVSRFRDLSISDELPEKFGNGAVGNPQKFFAGNVGVNNKKLQTVCTRPPVLSLTRTSEAVRQGVSPRIKPETLVFNERVEEDSLVDADVPVVDNLASGKVEDQDVEAGGVHGEVSDLVSRAPNILRFDYERPIFGERG